MLRRKNNYFIDCHCHLFNFEDIPLYPTISKINNLSRGLLLLAAIFKNPKKELKKYQIFFEFFDVLRRDSTLWLANQINQSLSLLPTGIPSEQIMTPLIMDFDKIKEIHKITTKPEDVSYQTTSLIREIKYIDNHLRGMGVKVLPFVGIDLRKLNDGTDAAIIFDELLYKCGGMKTPAERQDIRNLQNGDIIGVKLYPPMGFNPFSPTSTTTISPQYKSFYKLCITRDIPITVHCQPAYGSYYASDVNRDEANKYVHVRNWEKIFQDKTLQALRINFAHFGGDTEIANDVLPNVRKQTPQETIEKGTWTYTLIRLLKMYDNTYADLAAFNYDRWQAGLALSWLLVLDENNDLDKRVGLSEKESKYKLKDKLLWGSDVPMILGKTTGRTNPNGRIESYDKYLEKFINQMNITKQKKHLITYEVPRKSEYSIPDPKELISKLTCQNPLKFLFKIDTLDK